MTDDLSPQTLQMLAHHWRGGSYAYWWTPDGERKLSLWFPLSGNYPAVPAAWHGRNVYFGVHPTHSAGKPWQRSTIATISHVNVMFSEFDTKDWQGGKAAIWTHLQSLPMFPSVIVDSGGGLHAYWWLTEPLEVTDGNRAYMRRCQAAWVDLVGGDDGAKDLARVLRLPGWQNRKPERGPNYPTVKIMEMNPLRVYPFARVHALVDERIAQLEANERERIAQDQARTGEVGSGAATYLLNWAIRHANTGSRHSMALWLAGRLKAEGLARWAANSVLRDFARQVNKPGERQIDPAEMDSVARYIWSEQ